MSNFEAEREKLASLEAETKEIGSTVGDLDKLSKTDPELLQKYSKVYFLELLELVNQIWKSIRLYIDRS